MHWSQDGKKLLLEGKVYLDLTPNDKFTDENNRYDYDGSKYLIIEFE